MHQVRLLTDPAQLSNGKTYQDLPSVFEGFFDECRTYCEKQTDFYLKKDDSLFGGYYVNDKGDCLIIT